TFKVFKFKPVTVFSITWPWDQFASALGAWQDTVPESEQQISSIFAPLPYNTGTTNPPIAAAMGQFVGKTDDLKSLLQKLTPVSGASLQTWEYDGRYVAGNDTDTSNPDKGRYIDAVKQIATLEGPNSTNTSTRAVGCTSYMDAAFPQQGLDAFQQ